eukprot:11180115-Lingulodinium_polyedra.AAC.1
MLGIEATASVDDGAHPHHHAHAYHRIGRCPLPAAYSAKAKAAPAKQCTNLAHSFEQEIQELGGFP